MTKKSNQMLKGKPLMYIQQPEFEFITAGPQVMQVKAVPKQEKEINEVIDEQAKENQENSVNKKNNQPKEQTVAENHKESDNVIKNGVRKKTFVNKTIEEKLLFLTNLPKNMPPVTCEFQTKNDSYRGIVLSYVDGLVTIRTITSPEKVQLNKEEITRISIISL